MRIEAVPAFDQIARGEARGDASPLGSVGRSHPLVGDAMKPSGADAASGELSFGDVLERVAAQANQAQNDAGAKADALARGTLDDLHGTMISAKEAEISMKLVGTVRNKLLDAFHEIWRTGV